MNKRTFLKRSILAGAGLPLRLAGAGLPLHMTGAALPLPLRAIAGWWPRGSPRSPAVRPTSW
ncbi:MAG TPA: hypothetical protein VL978_15515 [Puia sp.]|nr:hypothetical protein [Puia sp.]